MNYSQKIKEFMEVKGLSNRDLARKLEKDETRVSRWANADKPSLEFLMSIAKAFPDFDLNYIMREKVVYPELDNIEYEAAEERDSYGQSATDIIEEIESKLTLLKKKVAQNSHK